MRIVAGQYRGKKLYSPEIEGIRPTSERAREAIFNILNSKLGGDYSNMQILDVFAGTGAFGFEALSRGFKSVTFMDINTDLVVKNAKLFAKEQNKINIIKTDATKMRTISTKFDMFFSDAPYAKGLSEKALQQLSDKNLLENGAIGIVEIRKDEQPILPQEYTLFDERIYGLAKVLFLKYNFCQK